ncbi:MAG TPA: M20/M25/M40 family metallo-hydrolase [Rhizomicrobium sp.]|jgi:Zn-dependent M28 family amino/carboxypeptidase|nr:M20/M25/M40 family metallo-hydrolase [Rhizomicrobium sp.]
MPLFRTRTVAFAFGAALLALPALAAFPAHPANTTPDITAADLSARDKAISDDAFQGRGPGTQAGEQAAQWIADELKRIGIAPGNHGSYFQEVPAVNITLDAAKSKFVFSTPKGDITPKFPDDAVYWTPQFANANVKVSNSDLVFVGYGVVAPEYNWNDYAGVNVKGKTVVILINDPGNEDASPDAKFFKGKAMTYYGRWTYKYEEAARQGAAAAIIVHETVPAAYGWEVVRNSNSGAKSWLDAADQDTSMVPIQGWITLPTAQDLFQRAGLNYETLKAAANKPGFKAVPMTGDTLNVDAISTITHLKTRNVAGIIPGSTNPDDVFIYSAHWDHLGVKPDVAGPDKIYNGAVDNGMGVSSVLELAEAFKHAPQAKRSIAFLFWTMEEQGLLGSDYFARHPLWSADHIVGVINTDANGPEGLAHDMVLPGSGQSELEDYLSAELKKTGRTLTPDPEPEKGAFFRSDHFSMAKQGIPAISPGGGYDMVNGGKTAGQAIRDDYRIHHYHQPSDEWKADWDLSGPVADLHVLFNVGETLANSDAWPDWYKDSEFRAARDKAMAAKK